MLAAAAHRQYLQRSVQCSERTRLEGVVVVEWGRDGVIMNIKRFRLKQDADEDAFLVTDARLQRDFTLKQPGILECLTARTTTGEWLVLHTWAVAEMGESPTAGDDPYLRALTDEWIEFIDESTATSTPFQVRG